MPERIIKDDQFIGYRVAVLRDRAGMTQQQLADRIGVSRNYLALIERGRRPIVKRAMLIDLAFALGVAINELTRQPMSPRSMEEMAILQAMPRIRQALDVPDVLPAVRPLHAIATDVTTLLAADADANLPDIGSLFPDLLAELLYHPQSGPAAPLLVRTIVGSTLTIKSLGYLDLSMRLAERATMAANASGDPVLISAAGYLHAQVALSEGVRARSMKLAAAAASVVEHVDSDEARTWQGMAHLHMSLTAASLGQADTARDHLNEAAGLAEHVDRRVDPWWVEFTPDNVGIWRLSIALENGDGHEVPELSKLVDPAKLRIKTRRSRWAIETGRGHFLAGNYDKATNAFLHADGITPFSVRPRPSVREMTGHMLREARRKAGSSKLRTLAGLCGVDPLAEVGEES